MMPGQALLFLNRFGHDFRRPIVAFDLPADFATLERTPDAEMEMGTEPLNGHVKTVIEVGEGLR